MAQQKNTPQLVMYHGLPGSGKSTHAHKYAQSEPRAVVINRDDIRTELFGDSYHELQNKLSKKERNEAESMVTETENARLEQAFRDGKIVVSDNTNLNVNTVSSLVSRARKHNAGITQRHVNVPIEEVKRRNRERGANGGRMVPDHIIDAMAKNAYDDRGQLNRFVISTGSDRVYSVPRTSSSQRFLEHYNAELERKHPFVGKAVVIVDVDGTLAANYADTNKAFGTTGKKDFDTFFKSIENSPVNNNVVSLANTMRDNDNMNLVVLTGRSGRYNRELASFIDRSGVKASRVITKPAQDFRPDNEFKQEVLDDLTNQGFVVVHSIDDRERSVNMYLNNGITVSRVQEYHPVNPDTAPETYPEPAIDTIYGTGHCLRCGSPLKNPNANIGPVCRTKG